jgi:hypothetical protein
VTRNHHSCSGFNQLSNRLFRKTELILQTIVRCILPKICGGNQEQVFFIDNDYHLNLTRVVQLLQAQYSLVEEEDLLRMQNQQQLQEQEQQQQDGGGELLGVSQSLPDLDTTILDSLSRLHIFHCKDQFQLLVTLKSMHKQLDLQQQIVNSSHSGISSRYRLLVIDSISAFYWITKHEEQVCGLIIHSSQDALPIILQLSVLLNWMCFCFVLLSTIYFAAYISREFCYRKKSSRLCGN